MSAKIVRFPTGRVADSRFMPEEDEGNNETQRLDRASHSAYLAMKATQRQYASLVIRMWRANGTTKPCASTDKYMSDLAGSGGLDALLLTFLSLRERRTGETDEEVDRISGEMRSVSRQILVGKAATEADWRALLAIVLIDANEGLSYANTDAFEDLYRAFVIDRIPDPVARRQELQWSRQRVEEAKVHLFELELRKKTSTPETRA